jgi:hypothetical protein
MSNAPESKWLTPNGGLPTGNGWDKSQLVEYTRTDIHDTAKARMAELEAALTALVELNDNHSPFGGEMYQDRIERTWDAACEALKVKP